MVQFIKINHNIHYFSELAIFSNPISKSLIKSSRSSIPTDILIKLSSIPNNFLYSYDKDACVIVLILVYFQLLLKIQLK